PASTAPTAPPSTHPATSHARSPPSSTYATTPPTTATPSRPPRPVPAAAAPPTGPSSARSTPSPAEQRKGGRQASGLRCRSRVQDCLGLRRTVDLTTLATPAYFATMAAEHRVLTRRAEAEGPSPADYVRPDTIASLSMGVGSLLMPLATRRLVRTFALGRGRWGWRLLGATAVAAA